MTDSTSADPVGTGSMSTGSVLRRWFKRVLLVLLALFVVLVSVVVTRHYFRVLRHERRIVAVEDDVYVNVFAEFGGGEPVDVHHGRWGGDSVGEYELHCLGISRATRYRVDEPLELDELAVQAERFAAYLESDGWDVARILDPIGNPEFQVSAARGTETVYLNFKAQSASGRIATTNCGQLKTVNTSVDDVFVESFTD